MEEAMAQMDEKISNLKDSIAGTDVTKGKLEGQINVLKEQIHTAQLTKEHLGERIAPLRRSRKNAGSRGALMMHSVRNMRRSLQRLKRPGNRHRKNYSRSRRRLPVVKKALKRENEIIELLNRKASVKGRTAALRYDARTDPDPKIPVESKTLTA